MTTPSYSTDWAAPTADGPLDASLEIPGSKSLTNRELVLSAIAQAPSTLRRALRARDTDLMMDALRALGARIDDLEDGSLRVTPGTPAGPAAVDCGLAGTLMRFLPPVAALSGQSVAFDGDPGARRRPMAPILAALRELGVRIDPVDATGLPFTVEGAHGVAGGSLTIDASASSQFVSGLLLSAPRFARGLDLTHEGPSLPSTPHIDMTVACLEARGVAVTTIGDTRWRVDPGPIGGRDVEIEPDLSNAAPFLAAAAVRGGSVTVRHWPAQTTQVGDMFPTILEMMGARVATAGGSLTVTGTGRLHGLDLNLGPYGELTPTVAAVAALADRPTRIRGVAHLRGHETNRLRALTDELNRLGGDVTETEDGLLIRPRPLVPGRWLSYDDHRMAMAGAIVGLAVPGLRVENIATTSKTLPEFPQMWLAAVRGRA